MDDNTEELHWSEGGEFPAGTELYLDGANGMYLPQMFAQCTVRNCVSGINEDDWNILLAGPDHEWYWEAWDTVIDDAVVTVPETGQRYTLWQDGDLWLIPEEES